MADAAKELETCGDILKTLVDHPESEPFREPVLWEEWGLTDYPVVVKEPMDLGTVRKKLDGGSYSDKTNFIRDVNLVWSNCMLYNADKSPYWKMAKKMQKMFERELGKHLGVTADGTVAGAKAPTAEEKAKFCRNIYNISPHQLGKILQQVDEKCAGALDKSDPNEIELNIDVIDGATFRALEEFVKDCLSKKASSEAARKKRKLAEGVAVDGDAAVEDGKANKSK